MIDPILPNGAASSIVSSFRASPDYPPALHFSGVLAHQEERSDEAVALITKSQELRHRIVRFAPVPLRTPADRCRSIGRAGQVTLRRLVDGGADRVLARSPGGVRRDRFS